MLQFTLPAEQGTLAENAGPGFLDLWGGRLAQLGVLGAIVLALIVFVLRPMTSRRPLIALAELSGPREFAPEGGARRGCRRRICSICQRRRSTRSSGCAT